MLKIDEVTMVNLSLKDTLKKFNGQKLFHLFKRVVLDDTKQYKKHVYTNEFGSKDLEKQIKSARFFVKHDGMCGFMLFEKDTKKFIPYTRYDNKKNKKTGKFKPVNKEWIQCEPLDKNATHWPHFRKLEEKKDKWQLEAFKLAKASGKLEGITESFTCEYMGKKCNMPPADKLEKNAVIVPHCSIEMFFADDLKTFEGIKKILSYLCIEGMVVYFENGRIFKILRAMFVKKNKDVLKWKKSEEDEWFHCKNISNKLALF